MVIRQSVKLIRVWRPLVSDSEVMELAPTETVGQLKARFKDVAQPGAIEVVVNGTMRGCSLAAADPCAKDYLPLADGAFPDDTVIHVNCRTPNVVTEASDWRASGKTCVLFDNRMETYDPINALAADRDAQHPLAHTLSDHERQRSPRVPPQGSAEAAPMGDAASDSPWGATPAKARDVGVLFPGQGAQAVGMGRSLVASGAPGVAELFARASAVLGYDLLQLCVEGPVSRLALTRYSQPAIFVVSLAAMAKLKHERPELVARAKLAAGFSLGEYSALVWAGALSFDDGLTVVKVRAEAMHEAAGQSSRGRGGMASVAGLDDDQLTALLAEGAAAVGGGKAAYVANYLFPGGRTLSGDADVLEWVCQHASARGAKSAKRLEVSGAFHSPYMQPARAALAAALRDVPIRLPSLPVYSNVTGRPYRDADQIRALLERQLVDSVLWEQSIAHIRQHAPCSMYLETGPGKQLRAMMRRIDNTAWLTTSVLDV